jgi:hypothetical protein
MISSSALPVLAASESIRSLRTDSLRRDALQRLYVRRNAIIALIRSLEEYENLPQPKRGKLVSISAGRKC